ncbi:MAG: T9SS type A sorting domain-containing protein [Bacteroidales bacterium]|nr:T9SS type A sorting domain-containing protein [Bacteroidales bacterium]
MIRKYKSQLLLFLLCLLTNLLWAQIPKQSFILETNETGTTRNYVARKYIILKSGFSYTATTCSFSAKVDTTLIISIATIPNPIPGDTTSASNDEVYTPGNTFSNDITQSVSGFSLITPKNNSYSNDTSYIFPILWFKTIPVTNNLNGGYKWEDITDNNAKVLKYSAQGAGHGDEYIITRDKVQTYNFNPAINLSYDSISKEILVKNSNLAQTTIIGVWGAKENYDMDKCFFAINGRQNESVLFTKRYVVQADSTKTDLSFGDNYTRNFLYQSNSIDGADINRFHEKSLRIGAYYRSNKPNTSIWGEPQKAVLSLGYKFDAANVNNTSVFEAQWNGFGEFKGYTPELLVFDRQLSLLDCKKFESYLAIKYGISLDTSYVSAKGDIIWDYNKNIAYRNRITGYGREDALGLSQKMATTSYEEMPFYTNQIDSYEANDSYRLSSPNRLLVMGCEPSNTMDDGSYIIFGDNNGSIANTDSLAQGFIGTMSRKWLVCTNIYPSSEHNKILSWRETGFTNTDEVNFKRNIIKPVSVSSASMVTTKALKGKDGYFAWTVGQEYGPTIVKFGTNQNNLTQNKHDYGYKIAKDGQVYSIQKGIICDSSLFMVERGQRIEIEKSGRIIYLRVNGVRYKNTEFAIDSIQKDSTYYGAIIIGNNSSEVKLTDFRHGGFVDTGHKVELSYLAQRASDFANYRNGKTALIIDRNAIGDFSGNIDIYYSDEVDEARSKIIFNNVFWDTDESGSDVFTFGYTESAQLRSTKIDISEEKTEPDENKITDVVQIYYSSMNDLSTVKVRVQMEKPSKAVILVYDLLGKCIEKRVLSDNSNVQISSIKLPETGVYIIKVTTDNMIYSQEIVSKM